jgi:hypothetical protein
MRRTSDLVLPLDPGYTAHREAEERRKQTREWLRRSERAGRAPSVVPDGSEATAPGERERKRDYSR